MNDDKSNDEIDVSLLLYPFIGINSQNMMIIIKFNNYCRIIKHLY